MLFARSWRTRLPAASVPSKVASQAACCDVARNRQPLSILFSYIKALSFILENLVPSRTARYTQLISIFALS